MGEIIDDYSFVDLNYENFFKLAKVVDVLIKSTNINFHL